MAQTMLITPSVSGHSVLDLKRQPLLQRLRPKPFSHLLLPPLPTSSSTSSPAFTTLALFKSKTKAAPPKKVPSPFPQWFFTIIIMSQSLGSLLISWYFPCNRLRSRSHRLKMEYLAPLVALASPKKMSCSWVVLPCSALLWENFPFPIYFQLLNSLLLQVILWLISLVLKSVESKLEEMIDVLQIWLFH